VSVRLEKLQNSKHSGKSGLLKRLVQFVVAFAVRMIKLPRRNKLIFSRNPF